MLASCSESKTIRAVGISHRYDGHDEHTEIKACLPDEHILNGVKIPEALEYVLWEVPWAKRLYKLTKKHEVTKLVYMECDHLPGRSYHPSLTWTNESVFDHVK